MPLILIATPIGNLKDITLRALEALKSADLIACEDTRVTGKLLARYGIKKPLLPYNDHNGPKQRPRLLAALAEGRSVALVSDAGTPLISDPGYKLVQEALAAGHALTPMPGACAAIAALTISGLPTDRFLFLGFLPAKAGERQRLLDTFKSVSATLVLYEAANRLPSTLALLAQRLGERQACVARELTKLHEEARRGTLPTLALHYAEAGAPKGEIVIVIAPPVGETADASQVEAALSAALKSHSIRDAAILIAKQFDLPRKDVYRLALSLVKP